MGAGKRELRQITIWDVNATGGMECGGKSCSPSKRIQRGRLLENQELFAPGGGVVVYMLECNIWHHQISNRQKIRKGDGLYNMGRPTP